MHVVLPIPKYYLQNLTRKIMPWFETGRFRRYNSDCASRILRALNDSSAKMKETAPTLRTKLFKDLEDLQREYDLLPKSP
jgi:hypothetical protein